MRNTKGRSRYTPQVSALTWGQDLERHFPYPSYHYDYVLAADVVYPHDYLEELLKTMRHFCRPGSQTMLLWANKIRFQSDLRFTECFKSSFNTTLLIELPQQEVRIYKATAKEWWRSFKGGRRRKRICVWFCFLREKRKFHFPLADLSQCREKSGFVSLHNIPGKCCNCSEAEGKNEAPDSNFYFNKLFYLPVTFICQ